MAHQPDAKPPTASAVSADEDRDASSNDERNAALALQLKTRGPVREERQRKQRADFLKLVKTL